MLVANAGVNDDKLLLQMDEESFGRVVDTNLSGPSGWCAEPCRRCSELERAASSLSPRSSRCQARPGRPTTPPQRPAWSGFARSLAREIGGRNVTVNVVAPGFIETDMTARTWRRAPSRILAQVPLRASADHREVAGVVRWLASDRRHVCDRCGGAR